jgi:hypothetical protein
MNSIAFGGSVSTLPFPQAASQPLGAEHTPSVGLQTPGVAQSWPGQTTGLAPVHTPAWQMSVCVQAFPSEHELPFAFTGFEQTPFAGSHTPGSWH